jgi:hypothetical protein
MSRETATLGRYALPCSAHTRCCVGRSPAAASCPVAGTGSYGSDADILAMLQPRRPITDDAPGGAFFSAKAFETHSMFHGASVRLLHAAPDTASAATRPNASSEPARFF